MDYRFDITDSPLQGLKIIQRKPISDERGYFERLFCDEDMSQLIQGKKIVQINHTMTINRGTVRGMHYQIPPDSEIKLASCLRGEVFDVVVDIRAGSPTFLQYHVEILSVSNRKMLFIPEGFAHGFQTLTDDCEMLYFHTCAFKQRAQSGLNAKDPLLNIQWPLTIKKRSKSDCNYPMLTSEFHGVIL